MCSQHHLILLCERLTLKLYDASKQIDEQQWGSGYGHGLPKSIVWCQSQCGFFILSTCRLYFLPLKSVEKNNEWQFALGDLQTINRVEAEKPWEERGNYLRYITTSNVRRCDSLHPRLWRVDVFLKSVPMQIIREFFSLNNSYRSCHPRRRFESGDSKALIPYPRKRSHRAYLYTIRVIDNLDAM